MRFTPILLEPFKVADASIVIPHNLGVVWIHIGYRCMGNIDWLGIWHGLWVYVNMECENAFRLVYEKSYE